VLQNEFSTKHALHTAGKPPGEAWADTMYQVDATHMFNTYHYVINTSSNTSIKLATLATAGAWGYKACPAHHTAYRHCSI
jgi:hypothetical protein